MNTCGGMVSMFASSEGRCGFESQLGKTKDYEMSICCFCAKYAVWGIKEGYHLINLGKYYTQDVRHIRVYGV
jgi:hypothetical protein